MADTPTAQKTTPVDDTHGVARAGAHPRDLICRTLFWWMPMGTRAHRYGFATLTGSVTSDSMPGEYPPAGMNHEKV
jgi:hypothetical protein